MHRPPLTQTTPFRRTSQVTAREKPHFLTAALKLAGRILAWRNPFPLLLLAAGLLLVQPCAGQSGTWTPTGSVVTARRGHTAMVLSDGKVLVAGGVNGSVTLASGELYDPESGTWTPTGSLGAERNGHT